MSDGTYQRSSHPVIRDLIGFLQDRKVRGVRHVHIGPYFCSRCLEPRDLPNQRYCSFCRRIDRWERHEMRNSSVSFHRNPNLKRGLSLLQDDL